jgi:mono/diheme cytochrome c family protein
MSEQGRGFARFYWPLIGFAALLLTAVFVVEFAAPARALPSYARQTGQPCGTCHTDFAGLTPYGRRFKINGYTNGGGISVAV